MFVAVVEVDDTPTALMLEDIGPETIIVDAVVVCIPLPFPAETDPVTITVAGFVCREIPPASVAPAVVPPFILPETMIVEYAPVFKIPCAVFVPQLMLPVTTIIVFAAVLEIH